MKREMVLLLPLLLLSACAGDPSRAKITVLAAPSGTKPAVAAQLDRGNALYGSRDWPGAEQVFRDTINADPGLAEAHYNLALTLDRQGRQAEAKRHYIEAANLAPGNKIIWDSPPLRTDTGGFNHDIHKKSFQDATPGRM